MARLHRHLPRDAPLAAIARAPLAELREGHRIRLGLADGRMGLWQHGAPPCSPLYRDRAYWRAYAFAASAWLKGGPGTAPPGRGR